MGSAGGHLGTPCTRCPRNGSRPVHDFRARAVAGDGGRGGLSETERAELLRLRRENSDLKLERPS